MKCKNWGLIFSGSHSKWQSHIYKSVCMKIHRKWSGRWEFLKEENSFFFLTLLISILLEFLIQACSTFVILKKILFLRNQKRQNFGTTRHSVNCCRGFSSEFKGSKLDFKVGNYPFSHIHLKFVELSIWYGIGGPKADFPEELKRQFSWHSSIFFLFKKNWLFFLFYVCLFSISVYCWSKHLLNVLRGCPWGICQFPSATEGMNSAQ